MLLFSQQRLLSTTTREVRVRFAPSPTGKLHFGGLRTALYNYIFAKQNAGKFILRIEDTDQSRVITGAEYDIEETLNWAGLKLDESPTIGGSFGPYKQSQRKDLYIAKADELVQSGKAYRCFCSPARLELLRNHQLRNRETPRYDGKCSTLTSDEVKEKSRESQGTYVIRFKLSPSVTSFRDMIFGEQSNDVGSLESDPIILKSDRFPTYHLANVVDDHVMNITHVLRGSEWMYSTTKHIQLYQAFGWSPPVFAHFPLVTMKDGSKMSKRNEHSHIQYWRDAGYTPLAILNFLINMGGGIPETKQNFIDLWNINSIVDHFNFKEVVRHPGSADLDWLNRYNQKDLKRKWEKDPNQTLNQLKELLEMSNLGRLTDINDSYLTSVIGYFVCRISTLNELVGDNHSYLWRCPKLTWNPDRSMVEELLRVINIVDLGEKQVMLSALKEVCDKHKTSLSTVRRLLTNNQTGLPLYSLCQILGKKRLLSYLESSLEYTR